MTQHASSRGDFAPESRDVSQQYIGELLEDNDRLRRQVATLESERTRLQEEQIEAQEQALTLRTELERFQEEQSQLRQQLSKAEEENHRFSARYVEVEEQNNNLANLYVASYQLHETTNRDEVLTALQEIIINLIGSEDFLILERKVAGGDFSVAASSGFGSERVASLDLTAGPIGQTASTGEMYLVEEGNGAREPDFVACVPMKLGSEVHGVIAIFRLLDHKESLVDLDYELFDLLASHAATSLCLGGVSGEAYPEAGAVA